MVNQEFFYRLISLPLFQGLTRQDAHSIATRVHFDFRRLRKDEIIARVDHTCDSLICVMQGDVISEEHAIDGSYVFEEWLQGPCAIQPERLYGLRNRYSKTFRAASDGVQVVLIPKTEVFNTLFEFMPFHLNFLNAICSCQQTIVARMWIPQKEMLKERFVQFLLTRSTKPVGHKCLHIGMVELGRELLATRLNVSKMLRELEGEGYISLRRGTIDVSNLETLCLKYK